MKEVRVKTRSTRIRMQRGEASQGVCNVDRHHQAYIEHILNFLMRD